MSSGRFAADQLLFGRRQRDLGAIGAFEAPIREIHDEIADHERLAIVLVIACAPPHERAPGPTVPRP
jgi:hypothetical protein